MGFYLKPSNKFWRASERCFSKLFSGLRHFTFWNFAKNFWIKFASRTNSISFRWRNRRTPCFGNFPPSNIYTKLSDNCSRIFLMKHKIITSLSFLQQALCFLMSIQYPRGKIILIPITRKLLNQNSIHQYKLIKEGKRISTSSEWLWFRFGVIFVKTSSIYAAVNNILLLILLISFPWVRIIEHWPLIYQCCSFLCKCRHFKEC